QLSVDDITIYFQEVGKAWADPDNAWRKLALELAPRITGYDPMTVHADVDLVARTLSRPKQYDFIETDLGDPGLLDESTRNRAVYRRCWPKGRMVHVMVGNVPLAALFTLYRSLVTKNQTIAKVPRRDVVTSLCFAHCIRDVDPHHPVARALSTLYWEPASD